MAWLDLIIHENHLDNALLRIVMIGDADENREAKLFIFCVSGLTFYDHKLYKQGAKAITYLGERRYPTAKTTDLLLSFLALREAKKAGALDALLVDREGFIREGTRSNFYAIRGNKLVVPPAEKVLEGVTKKIVLEVAQDNFKIVEEDIPHNALAKYDEFFITSTSMNVMPIKQIDDYVIHTNFEKTKIIEKLFKNYYEKNVL
jgi:branched-subunit amino acid aminotransferase/4-amino-4-deoxychorismate lyase